ncbi:MAG: PilT/PilU family type 4a pilus ATPase [Candidatus Sumerlaeota bacterium]|nr:PilT/PilU family type 4a pilus ATPase [Candidatus Sumerlaeota bacterium]
MIKLEDLLIEMVERRASDLFIKAGSPPHLRIDGVVTPMDLERVMPQDTRQLSERMMSAHQMKSFEETNEMDLAVSLPGIGRFRANVFRQRGSIGVVLRHVADPQFSFADLHLPLAVQKLAERPRGLVLVTGTTGSGKSTTLAAIINHINNTRRCHIVTIEDPIEFLHADNLAIISQREIGFDTLTFADALKRVMRQSPDVILIGEMRDVETIQTAMSGAETGHLVLSTLHTTDAVQTVERIIHYFHSYLHGQIRLELALTLQGVISQRLLPIAVGGGRVPAVEILIATPIIRKVLNEGRTLELGGFIAQSRADGMQTFNQCLVDLYKAKLIKYEDAMAQATSPDEFRLAAEGVATGASAVATFL